VDEYKGTPQLAVGRASDVQFVAEAPAIAPERDLGALAPGDVGRLYAVEGTISRVEAFSAGVKCLLDDASDTATLLLWQDLYDALPQRDALIAGAAVRVVGEVSEYQGEMEIVPELPSDVALLAPAEPLAASQRVAQIAPADVGRTVLVKGILTSLAPFSAGVKGTLDDGTGTITLLLWQDVYDGLADPATLSAGARLSVRGEIDQYLGEMEVVPQVAADVQIVEAAPVATVPPTPLPSPTREPAPTSTPPAEETAQPVVTQTPTAVPTPSPLPAPTFEVRMIGAITNADVGRTFTLDLAGIAGVGYLSRGVRFTVTDPTGSIVLLLWQDILEENPGRYDLFAGSQVRITGEIDEYEGELEIVPRKGADVTVVNRGERPPVEERPANGITAADEGRFLTVEGTVARLEGRQWMRVWLDDGTGQILIYVPERTMAYLSPGIGPGARLRVTGEVDVYQGEIEIVPLAGADVEVR
jgi:DNA/RNA endonuclease YhcR with UshA esterase domain